VTEEAVVIVGGTSGIGLRLAETFAARGTDVVITGRDIDRCTERAAAIEGPGRVTPIALDLAEPERIASALAQVGPVAHLVLAAIERDQNTARGYDVARAIRLVTLKLVGYTEVVHALVERLTPRASILLFGGLALRRPYPGSTTITTVNGGVSGLVRTLAVELAPIRVNAIHPGIVGDSPEWAEKAEAVERTAARTPIGRTVTMDEIVGASTFLLENGGVNGQNLEVDGGWLLL
jgi:NAD(P)-dependent dehydrogenase (short-subunit alcohol dehydrogenase family)